MFFHGRRVQTSVKFLQSHRHILYKGKCNKIIEESITSLTASNGNVSYQKFKFETIVEFLSILSWDYKETFNETTKQLTELFINVVIKSMYNNKVNYFKSSNNFVTAVVAEINRISSKIGSVNYVFSTPNDDYYSYLSKIVRILDTWCRIVYDVHFTIQERPLLLSKISEFYNIKKFMTSSKLYLEQSQKQMLSSECLIFEEWQYNNKWFTKRNRHTLSVDIIAKLIESDYLINRKDADLDELTKYTEMLCNAYIQQGSNIGFTDELYQQKPFIFILAVSSMLFNTIPSAFHSPFPAHPIISTKKITRMINMLRLIKCKFLSKCWRRLIDVGIADVTLARHKARTNDIWKIIKIIRKTSNYIVHTNLSDESNIFTFQVPSRLWKIYQYLIYNDKGHIISEELHCTMQQLKKFICIETNNYFHNPSSLGYIWSFLMCMFDDNRYGYILKNIIKGNRCNYKKCQNQGIKLKVCKRCRKKYYCSKKHQKLDWKYGDHRSHCFFSP